MGEQPGPQIWDNGNFPVAFPDAILTGSSTCIEGRENSSSGIPGTIAPSTHLFGIPWACWVLGAPANWQAAGGQGESGAATFAGGPSWQAAGGEGESGAATFAVGQAWTAAGGQGESGAATFAVGQAWTAAGGQGESGAATFAVGQAWTAAGGQGESGAATFAVGQAWTAAGGQGESGAATFAVGQAWTAAGGQGESGGAVWSARLFTQPTNTDITCDPAGETCFDLGTTVAAGTSGSVFGAGTFLEKTAFDKAWTGVDGAYRVSLNVTTFTGTGKQARFRLQVLKSDCTVLLNGTYSATFTATGVWTLSDIFLWPAGGVRLRVAIEYSKGGGLPGLCTITNGSTSYVDAPT